MSLLNQPGSATGNPRNKTALGKGKSLMDWVRLCNSGRDMTGTGGKLLNVTYDQLAKHNQKCDAWMAIRGVVYNVTEYISFHPGGEEELMRGVGIDATRLFNAVHPWVNYESLLKSCMVGRLRNINNNLISPPLPNRTKSVENSSSSSITKPSVNKEEENLVAFRMDWFQQASSISLVFYIKIQIKSPLRFQMSATLRSANELIVRIESEVYRYELEDEVRWPCGMKVHMTAAEVRLSKVTPKLWTNCGRQMSPSEAALRSLDWCAMRVVSNVPTTHDIKLIGLQFVDNIMHFLHVGHHVQLSLKDNESAMTRFYTPVTFLTTTKCDSPPSDLPTWYFLIKDYNNGMMSTKLCSLPIGSTVQMSNPRGSFNNMVLKKKAQLILIAAGTGMTPMTSLIVWTLTSTKMYVKLVFFNKTEDDIIWKQQIDEYVAQNNRFEVIYILSEPSASWTGEKGTVSLELIKKCVPVTCKDYYNCVCGPTHFNNLCKSFLLEIGYSDEDIFIFSG